MHVEKTVLRRVLTETRGCVRETKDIIGLYIERGRIRVVLITGKYLTYQHGSHRPGTNESSNFFTLLLHSQPSDWDPQQFA
jgi:hypothetical protein